MQKENQREYDKYMEEVRKVVEEKNVAIYEANKHKRSIDIDSITEFEKVKPAIRMKLINYEENKDLLEHVSYIRFLDLAIVFIVVLEESEEDDFISILVINSYLVYWNIGVNELYDIAIKNIENDFVIIPMMDVISEFVENENEECRVGVLTNRCKVHGAVGRKRVGGKVNT